ncbi:L-fuconate dehydratase [Paraglaciecola psychrophila]|uniref:L-fuconate dehydratase n=1 Tax=Paraglaciecola psychrophila 170 TaxID=1129794 RepID=K7A6M1_9ALTE|nr:L-fuconate dehydratase [Paraglaciecola psychrophila]AGH44431.1 mandelate racemase/muconate lactonizing enzyme family protein [Paraglaciecola psychrophila 170]GAC37982.1 mitochondrial enolase superfamily member 1 [Paraglaciecola psychrophila 170]
MSKTNKIISLETHDIRFPTSKSLDGSDATNKDPDYSAAYLCLETEKGNEGFGLVFTIGRGNDICCVAIEALKHLVIGKDFNDITKDINNFYDSLRSDSQLRWLGPEKGVIHMAIGAVVNAVWDMWARSEGKPLWRLLADMSPEQFVNCIDFRYLSDALTKQEALEMVTKNHETKQERIQYLEHNGYPSYTTSAGWLGYSDEKLAKLCEEALEQGFKHVKLKVGQDLESDIRRCEIARKVIGNDTKLMIDANQIWEVDEAIEWTNQLAHVKPWFIEEPTSPDDIFGHKKIKQNIGDIKVATGEHCHNRIMFKQFIANDAIDIVQIDSCRLASLNEILAVYLMAAKYGKPVCPHAGGVGLCEYVQHLSMIDYVHISADLTDRVVEFVDHLHEHFTDPCVIKDGAYVAPSKPGYSIEMFEKSVAAFTYPTGSEWQERLKQTDKLAS